MRKSSDILFLCVFWKVVGDFVDEKDLNIYAEKILPEYDSNYLTIGRYVEDLLDDVKIERKDLNGIPIHISVANYPPFLNLNPAWGGFDVGGVSGSGQAWELLRTLAEFYNFSPIIRRSNTSSIGYRDVTGTWKGAIKLLEDKSAELTILPVTISRSRREVVDFSLPMGTSSYGILIKRPANTSKPDALLKPFDYEVWIWVLISMAVMGPLIFLIIKIRVALCDGDPNLTRVFSLQQCIWFVFGAMMKQGSTLEPISDSARILFATWWMYIVLVTAFYTANLTAFLTFNGLELPIKDVADLKSHTSLSWIAVEDSALFDYIQNHPEMEILRQLQLEGKGEFVTDKKEAVERVREGTHVYIDDIKVLEYLIYNDFITGRKVDKVDRCDFYTTSLKTHGIAEAEPSSSFWWGFGFSKNSTYRQDFNGFFKRLNSYGIVDFLHQNFSGNTVCELPKGFNDRALQNKDLLTTYYLTLIGIALSMLIFGTEYVIRRANRKGKNTNWPQMFSPTSLMGVNGISVLPTYADAMDPYKQKVAYYDQPTQPYNIPYYYDSENNKRENGTNGNRMLDSNRKNSPIVEASVNGERVLWDTNANKLVVRDRHKLEQHASYIDGEPFILVKFVNNGKSHVHKLNLNQCTY